MTGRRMHGPVALLAALLTVAGMVAAAPAWAAPGAGAVPASGPLPPVWPTPQQVTARPGVIAIPATVTEVTSPDTDQAALTTLGQVLRAAGVQTINQVTAGQPIPAGGLTLYVGTPAGNPAIPPALAALRAQPPAGLPAGGYVLAAGQAGRGNAVVLAGAPTDAAAAALGRYYAQASAIPVVVGEGTFENFLLTAVPALLRYDVRLYAADPADYQAALAAARAAGLPAGQVTQSFSTAWDQTSSGEYLVIAVGGPADDALYYNVCGWTAPDGLGAGSTPFSYASGPGDSLPPLNIYENGAGQTAADTAALSADLAYYAVHGAFPPGVSTPPAAAAPQYACAGTPGS